MTIWTKVDPLSPPAPYMVAISSDNCGSGILVKLDGEDFFRDAEDGWERPFADVANSYSVWTPAPDGFFPAFMEVTEDDWR